MTGYSVRLQAGDSVNVTLGLGKHSAYNGRNGSIRGFFKAKILGVLGETSLVRFDKRIAPDYSDNTWNSFVELCPDISGSDLGYVDEVPNNRIIRTGL